MNAIVVTWSVGLGLALALIVAVVAVLSALGAARWAKSTERIVRRLDAGRQPASVRRHDARELDGLPAPVARYFRAVLKDGQPVVSAVTVEHTGTFNLKRTGEWWLPFTSRQRVVTRRPGFVWNARIALLPGVAVRVHDAYVGGEGILDPAILGLFSLAVPVEADVLAQGEFMRYFAEAPWYPTALLPSQGVRWKAIDEHSATATLEDGTNSVTMRVNFGPDGLIETMSVKARAAIVGKAVVMVPWEARLANYRMCNEMLVPLSGEAAWLRPGGRAPYWRGTIASLAYEFQET